MECLCILDLFVTLQRVKESYKENNSQAVYTYVDPVLRKYLLLSGALSAGEVVGIVFGCILGAMLILFTVLFILVRMRGASSGERIRLTSDAGFSNAVFDLNDVPLDDQSES